MLSFSFHWYQLPVLVIAISTFVLMLYMWTRRHNTGGLALMMLAGAIFIWTSNYFLELAAVSLSAKVLFGKIQYVGIALIPALLLIFSLQYTGRLTRLRRGYFLLLSIHPIAVIGLAWTNDWHHLIWAETRLVDTKAFPIMDVTYGWAFWVHVGYTYILFLFSTLILLSMLLRSSELYRSQSAAIIVSAVAPWLGNIIFITGVSPYIDPTPFSFAISATVMAWGFYRFKILNIMPVAYERVVNSLEDGILVLNNNNEIINANGAARLLTNTVDKDIIGQPITIVLQGTAFPRFEHGTASEITLSDLNGSRRYLEIRTTPVLYGAKLQGRVVILRDITQQRNMEHSLRRQALVFENITDSVVITNSDGVISDCNPATTQLFGYAPEVLRGETIAVWCAPHTYERIANDIQEHIDHSQSWHRDIDYVRADGEVGVAATTIIPLLDDQDQMIARIVVSQDITQRKETERLLHLAKDQAEEASRAKSAFLANMSHEFRTPLTAIIGYAELIGDELDDSRPEDILSDLKKIQFAGRHLLELIDGVLDIAKIEAGKISVYRHTVDIAKLINEVVSTAVPLANRNDNVLTVNVEDTIGQFETDEMKLRQILLNLTSNAAKFTEKGTIKIDVHLQEEEEQQWMVFRVQDTGIGISDDNLQRVFEAFQQADLSSTRLFGGTGLGLTITQYFCRMLGGAISVESQVGVGTTFTVKLPVNVNPSTNENHAITPVT